MKRLRMRGMIIALIVPMTVLLSRGVRAQVQPPPVPSQEQPEVLTSRPVHEAFAEPVTLQAQAGLVVPNQPPANFSRYRRQSDRRVTTSSGFPATGAGMRFATTSSGSAPAGALLRRADTGYQVTEPRRPGVPGGNGYPASGLQPVPRKPRRLSISPPRRRP